MTIVYIIYITLALYVVFLRKIASKKKFCKVSLIAVVSCVPLLFLNGAILGKIIELIMGNYNIYDSRLFQELLDIISPIFSACIIFFAFRLLAGHLLPQYTESDIFWTAFLGSTIGHILIGVFVLAMYIIISLKS